MVLSAMMKLEGISKRIDLPTHILGYRADIDMPEVLRLGTTPLAGPVLPYCIQNSVSPFQPLPRTYLRGTMLRDP